MDSLYEPPIRCYRLNIISFVDTISSIVLELFKIVTIAVNEYR
ncbi:hypothetical protein ACQKND_09915 [Viridibacillus arvi]